MSYHLPTKILTHQQRVCSLYKKSLRNIENWFEERYEIRRQMVFLRHRFEENKHIKDLVIANKILEEGEEELFNKMHPSPRQFPLSPGGVAYEREAIPSDWVLDCWHPIEKAAFPEYFAKREERKKEFIKLYEKNFGRDT